MNKTVYILGAGFSMDAGAPSQEKLVGKIFEVHSKDSSVFPDGKIAEFQEFLKDTLLIPERLQAQVPLEDIFTPLDRCLLDDSSFRNLSTNEVRKKRDLIYFLIGKTLQHLLRGPQKRYVDVFAEHLVRQGATRINNYKKFDPIAVISTNWDILLDTSIKDCIDRLYRTQGVVDYCCHISSHDPDDASIMPGLEMLGKGGFNVKLLKIHGSLNWLQCPRCSRLYVDFTQKIAIDQYTIHKLCRHCNKNFEESCSHELISNLIMPTFLKNFSNAQYKLIWQNAGIELSEASKIIFIGYSLPSADFEMRQLLSRMVRSSPEIEVVDFGKKTDQWIKDTENRYRMFFGRRKLTLHFEGAKDYILNNFS